MSKKDEKKTKEEILAEMEQANLARIRSIRVIETPEGVVLQGRQINVSDLFVLDPDRLLAGRIVKIDGNFRAEGGFVPNLYQEKIKEVTGDIYVSDAACLPCLSVVGGDRSQMEKAYRANIPEFGITPEKQEAQEQEDLLIPVDDGAESFGCAFEDIPMPDDAPCWMSPDDDEDVTECHQGDSQWESAEGGVRAVGSAWADTGQSAKEVAIALAKKMREAQKIKDRQRYQSLPPLPAAPVSTPPLSGSLFQKSRPVVEAQESPTFAAPASGAEARLSGDAPAKKGVYRPRNSVFSM